jgi:hypothetical protein
MSRLLPLAAALWAVAHPGQALGKDWEFYGGLRLGGATGFVNPYTGTYRTQTTQMGPDGRPPGVRPANASGHTWEGASVHLATGLRYHLLDVEIAWGIDSAQSGSMEFSTGRVEVAMGLRAPAGWYVGYDSPLVSAFPSVLVGVGWGEMKTVETGDLPEFFTRSGVYALASVRYDVRVAQFFLRPELQFRALFAKKQQWADMGDSGGVEYQFDGVGYSWDLTGMVSVGVVFGFGDSGHEPKESHRPPPTHRTRDWLLP